MTNHPMLQMRESPPEIDVTKPALPKRSIFDEMPLPFWPEESAAQAPEAEADRTMADEPDAADPFKPGDRVMADLFTETSWTPTIVIKASGDEMFIVEDGFHATCRMLRRPTAAELLEHWGQE